MAKVHLPVIPTETGSLRADGSREWIHPAPVRGRFHTARKLVFALLLGVYLALPWVPVRGRPALLLDVQHRQFYLFGLAFNAQDLWLAFFFLTGMAFAVGYVTMLAGRVWCGWACPQTVFIEGLYRPFETLVNGPREARLKREKKGWTFDRGWRFAVTHAGYAALSIALAHGFAGYFVGFAQLKGFIAEGRGAHPEAFTWVAALSLLFYVDFGWFREQFCLGVCPYGRLQGVLTDGDSLAVGYDVKRGEPRGKPSEAGVGDCVDCRRCVVVCPTGIDIRNGTQLDCIGCTACIDACDEVMTKLHRPRGLVRYDSVRGLAHEPRRIVRPQLYIYTALGALGLVVATLSLRSRRDLEATVLRQRGMPYVLVDGVVRNAFTLQLVNKRDEPARLRVTPQAPAGVDVITPLAVVRLDAMGSAEVPLFVSVPRASWRGGFSLPVRVAREGAPAEEALTLTAPILGPGR